MGAIRVIEYKDWAHFKSDHAEDLAHGVAGLLGKFGFRGQADADWRLVSAFDRWFDRQEMREEERIPVAKRLLDLFSENLRRQDPRLSSEAVKPQHINALAQHHGVPTRLLDWSDSPYVAAFFAFSQCVELGTRSSVAIWSINLDSVAWDAERGVEVLRVPARENPRLENQEGLFTINRTPHASLEEYLETPKVSVPALIKMTLPSTCAQTALLDLTMMGITYRRLFPDATGSAKGAVLATILEHGKSLAADRRPAP